MVTGSHNPPDYNGFKVAFGKSTLFGGRGAGDSGHHGGAPLRLRHGRLSAYPRIREDYYAFMQGEYLHRPGPEVVVDAGNGTGGVVACPIMEEMGARR